MCIAKRDATSRSASRFARTAVAVIARARCRYGQPALKPVDTTSKRRRKARGVVADDARGQPRQPRQPRKSKGRRWRRLGPQDRRRRPRRRKTNPQGTQLQLTTARQEPDFVLSLVFTRSYHTTSCAGRSCQEGKMRRTGRAVCPIRTGMDLPGVVAGPGRGRGAPWGGRPCRCWFCRTKQARLVGLAPSE